jgi:4-amino-4-deoxy-L-arabinose transferase-like glycosyltransferase
MLKTYFSYQNRTLTVVLVLIFCQFFLYLGSSPLTDVDEGAFAEASREMLARGDWVSPWLFDAPRYDKPALIHWLQMVSFSIFGLNSWAARLPSAVAGLIWSATISVWSAVIVKRIFPSSDISKTALWAAVISGSSLGILAVSRASTADATLNAFLTLSLFSVWQAFNVENRNSALRWARFSGLFIGLGLLTKGPIAGLIPLVGVFFAATSQRKEGWKRLAHLACDFWAWIILFAITLPWYWLQYEAQGFGFISGFFGTHNIGRFSSTMHGFSSGLWYYPIWMMLALAPWLPIAIWTLIQLIRTGLWETKELWMCWGIFLFVMAFFTASATKLPHYGFYGLSGVVVIMAIFLQRSLSITTETKSRMLGAQRLFLIMLLFIESLAPVWWGVITAQVTDTYYREVFVNAQLGFSDQLFWFVIAFVTCIVLAFWQTINSIMIGGLIFSLVLFSAIVLPIINSLSGPLVAAAKILNERADKAITWRMTVPSLSFAANRIIKPGDPVRGSVVVMYTKDLGSMDEYIKVNNLKPAELRLLWRQGGVQIVQIQ